MASDESDDEPLSVLAASKRLNPDKFGDKAVTNQFKDVKAKKRKRTLPLLSIKINKTRVALPPVIARPSDVWLYLKDLKPSGPYNCLLCTEWFISKPKIIIHYILNHKKDFCGICRYFVPDRGTWWEHIKFHTPWPCSQCIENFPTEPVLRHHLSSVHNMVHCRFCHFRVSDGEQYNTHLFQKHNVTNVSIKDEEILWEVDEEGSTKFLCLLCSNANNTIRAFFNHYMGFHHFTLKCFTKVISGTDPPFTIVGADVSPDFVDSFKNHQKFGYIDLQDNLIGGPEIEHTQTESASFLNVLIPEVKHEFLSEPEDNDKVIKPQEEDLTKTYKGDEDFDITLLEVILLQQCCFDYVNITLSAINSNIIPENSDIDYKQCKEDEAVNCTVCKTRYDKVEDFYVHLIKMHNIKTTPLYSCRLCTTTFDTRAELENHISQELGEFDDLWLCQFCDQEFDNRELARRHLSEHMNVIEFDNCFSPQLGFKCKFCPTLFWNETDRETHQVRVHFSKHKEHYYKCEICDELFSDKIWFIHHHMDKHQKPAVQDQIYYVFKCCVCCLVLTSVDDMRSHFDGAHPDARKVYCSLDECKYKPLSQRKSFKIHLRMVHMGVHRKDETVTCTVCLREFPTQRACSAHAAQVHVSGKFKCKLCREVLHTMDERKIHYLIQHPGRHPFECGECGKSFQYKSSLYMHKQDHQPNKQTFTCNFCGKVFMKKDSFREHVQIHEGPRHACSYCPMRFVQRSNMLRHERRHTGERPYACPECPRTFADKGACTSHVRTHSKDTSYACVYCGQTFVQKSKLTYHIRKHTGENLETCEVCSKMFTSRCALREHMKIHNAVKNIVKCPLCEKKYADERYMLRHLRTSHALAHRLHPCPVCRKPLTSPHGLRHHVLTHATVHTFKCKLCTKECSCKRTMVKHLRRRHSMKGNELNVKDFYIRLNPRECGLDLDEETMTNIFGPPTEPRENILNNMVFKKPLRFGPQDKQEQQLVHTESTIQIEIEPITKEIKKERNDDGDEELEPTDFVSVKIEPTDDEEMDRLV